MTSRFLRDFSGSVGAVFVARSAVTSRWPRVQRVNRPDRASPSRRWGGVPRTANATRLRVSRGGGVRVESVARRGLAQGDGRRVDVAR